MTGSPERGPLRVEQALRLVPDLEALEPLRGLMLSASRPPEGDRWGSAAPYFTVGKRMVWPVDLRERRRQVLRQFTEHLASLYEAVLEVLEGEQRGDIAAAVRALLGGGEREERAGRLAQARAWYELALALSKDFQDRRFEFDALHRLGHLAAVVGEYTEAARYYKRGLALAEAQRLDEGIIRACQGLGRLGHGLGPWGAAEAWLQRGLALAVVAHDRLLVGRLRRDLGDAARRKSDLEGAAQHYGLARELFEALEAAEDMAFLLNSQGLLEAALEHEDAALTAYREALACLKRANQNLWLEIAIRINLAELFAATGRPSHAMQQLREGEEQAIVHSFTRGLAQIYTAMGRLARQQVDEHGFVFFEKALEFCRGPERAPILEAEIRYEYGMFRSRLGERDEAAAHLERAQQIFGTTGDQERLSKVRAELGRLRV